MKLCKLGIHCLHYTGRDDSVPLSEQQQRHQGRKEKMVHEMACCKCHHIQWGSIY